MPARVSDPLEAFRGLIEEREKSSHRTVRLRLLPSKNECERLMDIGLTCARLWNEISYEKRHVFFSGELSPEKMDEINKKYYYKYRGS